MKGASSWDQETGAQNESMTYNHNGNIKSIDNLIYTYNTANGNSLTKVDDGTTHDAGFNDGSGATTLQQNSWSLPVIVMRNLKAIPVFRPPILQ